MKKFKKILTLVTALALVMSMLGTVSFADSTTVVARAEAVTFNGHTYQVLYGGDMTWEAMEAYCESLGGYLACITTAEEDAFLYSYVSSANCEDSTLFGFSDAANEGTWVWVSGEETDYTNWGSSEPSDYWGNENYAHYYKNYPNGEWNDTGIDSQSNNFLIEWNYVDDGETNIIPEITVSPVLSVKVTLSSYSGYCYFYMNYTTYNYYSGSAVIMETINEGETVTFGVIPDTACTTYSLSVTDASGNDVGLTYTGYGTVTVSTGWHFDENGFFVSDDVQKIMYLYTFTVPESSIAITIANGTTEVHTWNEGEVVTEATCGENGEKLYTCSVCGDTYTEVIPATGQHTTEIQNAKDATCTEDGYTGDEVCTVCGETITTGETIPATGHTTEIQNAKDATCVEEGYTGDEVCTVCGETINAGETIPATGQHNYVNGICTVCGADESLSMHNYGEPAFTWSSDYSECTVTFVCDDCGDTQTVNATITSETTGTCDEDHEIIYTATVTFNGVKYTDEQLETFLASKHSFTVTEYQLSSDYKKVSYLAIVCDNCGLEKTYTGFAMQGRSNYVAPTCTTDGSGEYACWIDVNNTTYVIEIDATIEALGHSYLIEITRDATCTETGVITYTCSVCGDSYTEDIPATGHTIEVQNAKDATCTEDGYTGDEVCTVCSETVTTGQVIPATGHSYEAVVTAPTCTEKGYTTYTCSVCGDSYVADETEALGHSYEAVVTAPTCTEKGYTTYTCSVCGDTYVADETEALGHSYEAVVTAPTCTEKGYTTYTCSVCGDTYVADETEALGHSYEAVVTAPTCTEKGYTTYTCSVCGDTYVADETEALGHSYEAVVTAPTCTEKGYTTYTCSVCGDTYVADETEALGHSYVSTVTAPTCTEQGYTTHVCSVCGDTYVDAYVNALGHSYVDTVTAPTCTEQGYTTHVCSACGDTYVDTYTAALGHSYEFQYFTWANDLSSAIATFKCKNCGDILTVDATITGVGDLGVSAHIATVEFNGEAYTDTQTTGTSLTKVSADYSAVNTAIAKANALNASSYSNFATVTAIIESVNWNMSLINQDAVNAYAEAIETAIANLIPYVEETVNITEPIEDSTTETEPEEEVSEPEIESNPTTGIAISLLPMAVVALVAVSSKRK